MRQLSSSSKVAHRGFSLIEMLVVVTIIVLMLALATPALTRTLQATRLSSAGETLMGAIAEAQQTSFSTNFPVEMRFFSFMEGFDQSPVCHAYQLFKITTTSQGGAANAVIKETIVPIGNLSRLPEGIVIPTDITLSKAFFDINGTSYSPLDTKENSQLGYSGVPGATYSAIRFMPDGTCRTVGAAQNGLATLTFQNLPSNFFTVTFGSGTPVTLSNLPKNFFTIQIDPYTGKARSYKPGF